MNLRYTYFANIEQEIEIPQKGILSKTLHQTDELKVVMFGFARGEELSEHTASMPAILQILQGQADITLHRDTFRAEPGAWIYMPPHLPHRIRAETPVALLLLLLKSAKTPKAE